MEYRIAKINDYDNIIQMKNRVKERIIKQQLPIWQHGYPLDSMIEEDIEKEHGRVVEINGKIVAYSVFLPSEEEYDKGTFKKDNLQSFGRVMVDDGYTGLHIGKFLVGSMIEEAKKIGKDGMGITADECNIRAVNLYKSFGFVKEGSNQFPYAYLDIYGLYF